MAKSDDAPAYEPSVFIHVQNLRAAQESGDAPEALPSQVGEADQPPQSAANPGPSAFDAEAVLDGNVDAVKARLGDLSDDQRAAVLTAERAGKNRAGVISALG